MADHYAVYALRCRDGRQVHNMPSRTMRHLALVERTKQDRKVCGPHTILQATVTVSAWRVLDESVPDPQTDSREQMLAGAQRFACPKCQAPVGAGCENLISRAHGELAATRWPHAERTLLWSHAMP